MKTSDEQAKAEQLASTGIDRANRNRKIMAVLLALAAIAAGVGAVMGAFSGAYYADGGADNSWRGPLLMGLVFAQAAWGVALVFWCAEASERSSDFSAAGYLLSALDLAGVGIGIWVDLLPVWALAASAAAAIVLIILTFLATKVVRKYDEAERAYTDIRSGYYRRLREHGGK